MFNVLTHSELSAIHDIALARARLDGYLARRPSFEERDALTAKLVARIAALPAEAQAELLALVRLGQNGHAHHEWTDLLEAARRPRDVSTPQHLAAQGALDAAIERGLLALDGRE